MKDRSDIARQCFAQVRIEIRQAGTVDDEIQMARELRSHLRGDPQPWLAHVAFDHFDARGNKLGEPVTQFFLQWIEYRRLFKNFLKSPLRSRCALAANQQINLADLRHFVKKLCQPYLPDKARHPDEQNIFPREGLPDRKGFGLFFSVEYYQRSMVLRCGTPRR